MDYEKRYKALIEAIKILKEANPSDEGIQDWVNDSVPELQESEDEKIRKEIIDFIYDKTDTYELREKSNSWLAWLEKQSKQKSVDNANKLIRSTMNKNCTSVQQSQKLITLGIDANTADMFYTDLLVNNNHKYNLHLLESYGFKTFGETKLKISEHLGFIPAWSFSALIELMPKIIDFDGEMLTLSVAIDPIYNEFVVPYKGKYNAIRGRSTAKSMHFRDNLIDAAVETIYWLKENKKI